ncbi:glycosyltransferase family 2 protein [Bacillus sp. S14(2024)]|uniref:glycosyltransferase family 2 protein n=1 Tax=Bacillus sp. S14(2024) TaxID=3162884 RepID=UPI003D25819E
MLVTIGLPFYNCEKTLQTTIQSIFAQTYSEWELVLIDDGSSDRSLELAQSIKDPRVKVYHDGENRGLVYRLNQITSLAKGEYIARMDADDIMHPERIKKQLEFLQSNPDIDLIGTRAYIINENDDIVGKRKVIGDNIEPHIVLAKGLFIHPTVMGKAEWFRSNLYSEEYVRAEDHEIWVRTLETSNFFILEEPLLFYRENSCINLKNYRLSCKTDRKIFRNYGPNSVGRIETVKLVVKSCLKEYIYILFSMLKAEQFLINKRNNHIVDAELVETGMLIERIQKCKLPI